MTSEAITAGAAGTWTLGDLTVNRIGLGAMRLTGGVGNRPVDRDQAITVLRRALDLGVNHGPATPLGRGDASAQLQPGRRRT